MLLPASDVPECHPDPCSAPQYLSVDPLPIDDPDQSVLSACGISWDGYDIARFLRRCRVDGKCLIWDGAKSRGRGNTAWYGSFWTQGKTVRAHKFYAVAVLGLRPAANGSDHLDHHCSNSLCVSCVICVPSSVNLKLRWLRLQVGLDDIDEYEKMRLLKRAYDECDEPWPGDDWHHWSDHLTDRQFWDPTYWEQQGE